jgi:hypothetical protein
MNADDSARDAERTDWVTAAMAGRGSDIPPPPATGGRDPDDAFAIAAAIVEFVIICAAYAAFG